MTRNPRSAGHPWLDGFYAFLAQPLDLRIRPLLALLVIPLALAATQPLWHFHMEARQYPEGLAFDVYAHKLESGHAGRDLREVNVLNHYIGMHKIDRSELGDLDWLQFGIGVLAILVLRVAAVGSVSSLVDLAVISTYFALFSAGRFAYKLYSYGHDLAADAPLKVAPFTPPIWGSEQVGNFTSHAQPGLASYFLVAYVMGVVALTIAVLWLGWRRYRAGTAMEAS